MNVLVTGGAGYIGSHTVQALRSAGHDVVVFDDLSTGHRESVPQIPFIQGDIARADDLNRAFGQYQFDAVMHFAAKSLVGESMQHPAMYYHNNVVGGATLLEIARNHGVQHFIFSSTAAVYGEPESVPITEDHPLRPTSVYGRTKLIFEQMLQDYHDIYGLKYAALRYFNAAGADPGGQIGEDHNPETHLIPIILEVALGKRPHVTIFGTDYATDDGTCVRDYIHVTDLAQAHVLALEGLASGVPSGVYNLGNGNGFSVREVIETAERVVGAPIAVQDGPRRAGDPAVLVASAEKAKQVLGWKPQYGSLEDIVSSAWNWHRAHPNGYRS